MLLLPLVLLLVPLLLLGQEAPEEEDEAAAGLPSGRIKFGTRSANKVWFGLARVGFGVQSRI